MHNFDTGSRACCVNKLIQSVTLHNWIRGYALYVLKLISIKLGKKFRTVKVCEMVYSDEMLDFKKTICIIFCNDIRYYKLPCNTIHYNTLHTLMHIKNVVWKSAWLDWLAKLPVCCCLLLHIIINKKSLKIKKIWNSQTMS